MQWHTAQVPTYTTFIQASVERGEVYIGFCHLILYCCWCSICSLLYLSHGRYVFLGKVCMCVSSLTVDIYLIIDLLPLSCFLVSFHFFLSSYLLIVPIFAFEGEILLLYSCIEPLLGDRLKEKLLKPWKGAHSSQFRVCLSVCVSQFLS